jgi:hypothetical protein
MHAMLRAHWRERMARSRHRGAAPTHGHVTYNRCFDPNAVFVGDIYADSDPDPNIRAALIREFGRRGRSLFQA